MRGADVIRYWRIFIKLFVSQSSFLAEHTCEFISFFQWCQSPRSISSQERRDCFEATSPRQQGIRKFPPPARRWRHGFQLIARFPYVSLVRVANNRRTFAPPCNKIRCPRRRVFAAQSIHAFVVQPRMRIQLVINVFLRDPPSSCIQNVIR